MTQRVSPFGRTRTHVAFDHALIAEDSYVTSPLLNWESTSGVVLISPVMGSWPRSPKFVQYLAYMTDQSSTVRAAPDVQRLVYVLDGSISIDKLQLSTDMFAWLPPNSDNRIATERQATVLVFEKIYAPLAGVTIPQRMVGTLAAARTEPFLGDPEAVLSTLLPIEPAFDMAVNVFTYQSGATLPFVETHVMEHGLYMRSGQGVYRLSDAWYPVTKGDTIWMAAYCPQWFVAMGKGPASYIYYKDIHRDPLKV